MPQGIDQPGRSKYVQACLPIRLFNACRKHFSGRRNEAIGLNFDRIKFVKRINENQSKDTSTKQHKLRIPSVSVSFAH